MIVSWEIAAPLDIDRHQRNFVGFARPGRRDIELGGAGLVLTGEVALGLSGTGCGAVDGPPDAAQHQPHLGDRGIGAAAVGDGAPPGEITTQLISTAPPLIFTQAGIREATRAKAARGDFHDARVVRERPKSPG